jgi:Sulfotransferase family
MIISHSRKFVFIHIHKTAGESISEALVPFLAKGDFILGTTLRGELANAWYERRHGLQKHSGVRKVKGYLGDAWDGYLKFSFVRDPYDRLRSLYFYFERMLAARREKSLKNALLLIPGTDFRDPLKWPGMKPFLETDDFSGFIRHPEFSTKLMGARPQAFQLSDREGNLAVDFVGRFETLAEDFATLAGRLGLEGAGLGHRNASRNRAATADPAEAADRALVAGLYARDYALFGYPLPPAVPGGAAKAAAR